VQCTYKQVIRGVLKDLFPQYMTGILTSKSIYKESTCSLGKTSSSFRCEEWLASGCKTTPSLTLQSSQFEKLIFFGPLASN